MSDFNVYVNSIRVLAKAQRQLVLVSPPHMPTLALCRQMRSRLVDAVQDAALRRRMR